MSKTTEKLGTPVLTLTGQMKRAMSIYNTNRRRRDPDYEAEVEAKKLKKQAIQLLNKVPPQLTKYDRARRTQA